MNKLDQIKVDLQALYNKVKDCSEKISVPRGNALLNHIYIYINGFLIKTKIREKLLYSGFITSWFNSFFKFWSEELSGRPIDIIDFHFLRLMYRLKFQTVKHTDENNKEDYLAAWQKNENIYMLFATVWKYAKTNYLDFFHVLKFLPKEGAILEYGAGLAPITTGLMKYLPHRRYRFCIADIMQINFVYGLYMLSRYDNVKHLLLLPHHNLLPDNKKYDAIFCTTVLEHVPNPDQIVGNFYSVLNDNAVLIIDFVKSEGDGLDSKGAVLLRNKAIDFLTANFDVLYGSLNKNISIGRTVLRKK